jgi:two-component system, NtrC family, nitrogen regulation response regulator GlnG
MQQVPLIYIIDDDDSIRWVLERFIERNHYQYESFSEGHAAKMQIAKIQPDMILCDIRLPDVDGLELLQFFHKQYPDIPIVMMTGHSDLQNAVHAFEFGAFEYLPKPFDLEELLVIINRALHQEQGGQSTNVQGVDGLIGTAPAMQEVFRLIGRLARSSANVLITGASGTGKELIASSLHQHSMRRGAPFVALNMAAIPAELIESELFGHEKGAFTGAAQIREGRFEQAQGGTLFLDEIGDMPLDMQTRLLRVLATNEFYRVGGTQPLKADVRILAATHQNLPHLVENGQFREDLYHRLNVVRINLPDLKQRIEDIPTLAEHFLMRAASELNCQPKSLMPEALDVLRQFNWPGNVRQLENVCRWLTVMTVGQTIYPQDLPEEIIQSNSSSDFISSDWAQGVTLELRILLDGQKENLGKHFQEKIEVILLETILAHTQGHKQKTAQILGWGRNTVSRKIKELGIDS